MTRGHRGSLLLRCRTLTPCPFSRPVYPGAPQPLLQHPGHRDLRPRPATSPASPRHPAHTGYQLPHQAISSTPPRSRRAVTRSATSPPVTTPTTPHPSPSPTQHHVRRTGLDFV